MDGIPCTYREYEVIERHLAYSQRLHHITYQGQRILREIELKKNINGKKKLLWNVQYMYHLIENIVKQKPLCNNNYSSLIHYIDELLFLEVRTYNTFTISDETYPLSYIYFHQHEWIQDDYHTFILDTHPTITELDAMLINCFIDEYEELLLEIEDSLTKSTLYMQQDSKLVKKLHRNLKRLKARLILLRSRVLQIIEKDFNKYT